MLTKSVLNRGNRPKGAWETSPVSKRSESGAIICEGEVWTDEEDDRWSGEGVQAVQEAGD